ncbi:hypothetical protein Jiend_48520 [Micromonospora endophytica]|nr:hypothetical protein Jiend_48520 [Micromonospora endophytica]
MLPGMNDDNPRLGIDIGRVIIDGSAHPCGGDTAFFSGDEATMLATPEVPGAIETIARLVPRFGGRVWLVSKCGPRVQARTLRWLVAHDFYRRTGVDRNQVRFCRARADKRVHCLDLDLTHFVDDHPEVHAAIRGAVAHQYFFGPQRRPVPRYGHPTPTWVDVERLVTRSLVDDAAPSRADRPLVGEGPPRPGSGRRAPSGQGRRAG